jgi:hypothetical protein
MRRILSLPGLAIAVWVSSLVLLGLLGGMLIGPAWHPHFLPVTAMLALVIVTGLALLIRASWRIIRGPGRRRALSWLLIGAAPLWFLAGHFLYGLAIGEGRRFPMHLGLKLMMPLAESLMDLEARFRYPQRTYGEKIVMISPPMPEAEARAQVAAMDRHIRALEARLGRRTAGLIHWARGPLLGMGGKAILGLCLGSSPGDAPPDAEGLCTLDRHEVAHCVATSHCNVWLDAPAVLLEGWAEANQGTDPIEQAGRVWEDLQGGSAFTLRTLTGPDWYDRHDPPAYEYGAPLVNVLLERFGPAKFLELYTTCTPSTFESDCRRTLGLDLDGLDAVYRAEVERQATQSSDSLARRRLERLRLGPGVSADDWKAFVRDYFAAMERLLAPYRHVRLSSVWTRSTTDAAGRTHDGRYEARLLRSGEFASMRRKWSDGEVAYLAHPHHSIAGRRNSLDGPWEVEDESKHTPDHACRRALKAIDGADIAGHWAVAPLVGLADYLSLLTTNNQFVVAACERFADNGQPRMRVRIEDRSPAPWYVSWRAVTYVLAADDLYAPQSSIVIDGPGADKETSRTEFAYDRLEGIPVLRWERTTTSAPNGAHGVSELKVVERHFGPIPEEEFDPDRFLDGPQVKQVRPDPDKDEPSMLRRWYWLPFPIGALGLIAGVGMSFGGRRNREAVASIQPAH